MHREKIDLERIAVGSATNSLRAQFRVKFATVAAQIFQLHSNAVYFECCSMVTAPQHTRQPVTFSNLFYHVKVDNGVRRCRCISRQGSLVRRFTLNAAAKTEESYTAFFCACCSIVSWSDHVHPHAVRPRAHLCSTRTCNDRCPAIHCQGARYIVTVSRRHRR